MTVPSLIEVVTEETDRLSDCSSAGGSLLNGSVTMTSASRLPSRLSIDTCVGGGLRQKRSRQDNSVLILGIDHPMVDITAEVDDEFIERYDVPIGSACLASDRQLPLYEELMSMPKVTLSAGGTTLNTIRVAHWILGGDECSPMTGYMGAVGRDKLGDFIVEKLRSEGIVESFMRTESATAKCASCLKSAERGLITILGAANEFRVDHLRLPQNREILRRAGIVYSTAFFFNCNKGESLWTMADACKTNHSLFAFNLAAPYMMRSHAKEFNKILGLTDIVFGNETEAKEFARMNALADDTPAAVARHLAFAPMEKPGLRTAVITQGKRKTVLARSDGVYLEIPVPPVNPVVDTNAAGDAFVGGYLAGIARGENLWTCVEMAHRAAGHIIQKIGCTFEGMFKAREIYGPRPLPLRGRLVRRRQFLPSARQTREILRFLKK